jgi:catechol 2,3-dioxygenase-like lactoylglutathione lyase family enzyme
MARTLHHVDLTVSDLALAKRFYKPMIEYLGYRMTEDTTQISDCVVAERNTALSKL